MIDLLKNDLTEMMVKGKDFFKIIFKRFVNFKIVSKGLFKFSNTFLLILFYRNNYYQKIIIIITN